jgi:hypothetical protein
VISLIPTSLLAKDLESNIEFVGRAYAVNSDQLLYVERHRVKKDAAGESVSSKVNYFDSSDKLIAAKSLDFTNSQTMPELRFVDQRLISTMVVSAYNQGPQNMVRITAEQNGLKVIEEVSTNDLDSSIIDAGFDQYVTANWQKLLDQETVEMEFLALTRAQFIGFELEAVDLNATRKQGLMILTLRPNNFFIRLLVDAITLTYDINARRILSFEGLTNIEIVEDGQGLGKNHLARIEYSYH